MKRQTYFINYGGGVNSTAILSLLCKEELKYPTNFVMLADTGGEQPETYKYLDYIKPIVKEYGYKIIVVKSKEGSLYDYCVNKKILPMRHLRWCTDRWKRKPLNNFRKNKSTDNFKTVIGIDYGERKRADRWKNDVFSEFPLINLRIDRKECISLIKAMNWKIPIKSGCWFCPYAKMKEFKELKINHRNLFNELCELEKVTLKRLEDTKLKGWYDEKRPLNKAIEHRYPETHKEQTGLCMYCEI